jgi:hypothetical protein
MSIRLLFALALVACSPSLPASTSPDASGGGGGGGGGGDGSTTGSDGSGSGSGSDTGGVPATIKISGQAHVQDQTTTSPQSGVAIAIYASSNDSTPLATATTDGSGNYSVTLTTNGAAIDGYIKATKSGLVDTYVYPPAPMATDSTDATASMVSTSNYSALLGIESGSTSKGFIILIAMDSSLSPLQGATVTTSPSSGTVTYMNSSDEPFSTSSTYTDGLAFLFNVPVGDVSVAASKSGSTFTSHTVSAHANALTTTVVIAQ